MVTVGGVVSTAHRAGFVGGPTFPAASVARTWKVCAPSLSPEYVLGVVQISKFVLSSLHSKLATPLAGSTPVKVKVADGRLVAAGLAVVVTALMAAGVTPG